MFGYGTGVVTGGAEPLRHVIVPVMGLRFMIVGVAAPAVCAVAFLAMNFIQVFWLRDLAFRTHYTFGGLSPGGTVAKSALG